MWFNLKILKEMMVYYLKVDSRRVFLFIPKKKRSWSVNSLYFNKSFNYKFTFARKTKKLLIDSNNYFFFLNKEKLYFKNWSNLLLDNTFIFFYYIILLNNISFWIKQKYNLFVEKKFLLKKKYFYLLKKNNIYNINEKNILNNVFLLYKYFFLIDQLLVYFDLYIYFSEYFFFDFGNLKNFLKNYFLRKCSAKLKLKIWGDCHFTVDHKHVFFEEKSIWIKNLDIFEEDNKIFFDKISLENTFAVWDVYKSKELNINDLNFKFLYYKYKFILSKLEVIKFKMNLNKKKLFFIDFFLLNKKFMNTNKFFKNKFFITKLIKSLPLFLNRNKLLKIIYSRKKKIKLLKLKEKNFRGNIVLNFKKENIVYRFFFIIFINYFKKQYIKEDINFINLRKKFLRKKFLRKKNFNNFKTIFFLFYKLNKNLKIKFKNFYKNFIFSFLFFFVEKKLFKNNKNNLDYMFLLKTDILKEMNILNINDYLFDYLFKLLAVNFSIEVDDFIEKRYDLLYKSLFGIYKKYWNIVNFDFLNKFEYYETKLLLHLHKLKIFFLNELHLKRLYDLYVLFSFDFWTLSEYINLMNNMLKQIKFILVLWEKNKKQKNVWNLRYKGRTVFFRLNKKKRFVYLEKKLSYLNKKTFKYSLFFNLLIFLKNKLNSLNSKINWNLMLKLYNISDKNRIKKLFKLMFFTSLKSKKIKLNNYTRKIPFFLKMDFNIVNVFFFYLENDQVKDITLKLKKIVYSFFFILILKKINKLKKKNFLKIKNFEYYFLLFLEKKKIKKKLKKKKKFFPYVYFDKNQIVHKDLEDSWFYFKEIDRFNIHLQKKEKMINSLEFFLNIKVSLYEKFLFIFKQNMIKEIVLIFNNNFLSSGFFFDLKNDFKVFKKNIFFVLNKEKHKFLTKYSKFFNIRWWHLKNLLYSEILNILINQRFVFLIWYNLLNYIKKYVDLLFYDELFIVKNKYLNFFQFRITDLFDFKRQISFLIYLFIRYFNFFQKDSINLIENNQSFLNLNNRSLLVNNNLIRLNSFIIKLNFVKLVFFKKKRKKKNFICYENIITSKNLYLKNILLKKNIFNLDLKILLNYNNNFICRRCDFLYSDIKTVNIIKYYQNFLKLDKINTNIIKFDFIICEHCSCLKITLKKKPIRCIYSYISLLKHYASGRGRFHEDFIYYQNKIQYCSFLTGTNYIVFEELKLINLNLNKYYLKFFFCYFIKLDKFYFNSCKNLENVNYLFMFKFFLYLIELFYFYNKNAYLNIPQIVTMYGKQQNLEKVDEFYRTRLEVMKLYKKKLGLKATKKEKKEKKKKILDDFFKNFTKKKI